MDRRTFLHYTGAASLISSGIISPTTLMAGKPQETIRNYQELLGYLLKLNDKRVPEILEQQDLNPESEHYGGVCDSWKIHTPGSTCELIKLLAMAFSHGNSKHYRDESLLKPMEIAAKYLIGIQHDNGAIDLLSTNFQSAPDTGFVVEPLCATYKLLKRTGATAVTPLLDLLEQFLRKAGEALISGGVHTPNHRWVISMAMARLNELFPDKRYLARIDEWLREGIDIDKDGQYEEKSTYIYTPLTNRCLLTLAKLLNRPELLGPVRKNLNMTLFYIHPNGEIATEASGRQDQFQVGFMEHYYIPLRYMALKEGNGQYARLVEQIEGTVPQNLSSYLVYLLEDDFYSNPLPPAQDLPDNYIKEFSNSNLVRIRRGNIDATILGENPTFFTLSKGNAVLASLRIASAFFGRGQFKSKEIEREGDSFTLKWEYSWGYFQPFPEGEKPNYHLPFDTDRRRREKSEIQDLKGEIVILEKNGFFELDISIEGTENVPVAIEMAFRNGGVLSGVTKSPHFEKAYLLKEGTGKYRFEEDEIEFGPGHAVHEWTAIRGGLPKPDGECVYLTGFTGFKRKIKIG